MEQILLLIQRNDDGLVRFLKGFALWQWILTIVILSLLAIIPAAIASNKGFSGAAYFFFGFFLFPFALVTACLLPSYKKEKNVTDDTYALWALLTSIDLKLERIEKQLQESNEKK